MSCAWTPWRDRTLPKTFVSAAHLRIVRFGRPRSSSRDLDRVFLGGLKRRRCGLRSPSSVARTITDLNRFVTMSEAQIVAPETHCKTLSRCTNARYCRFDRRTCDHCLTERRDAPLRWCRRGAIRRSARSGGAGEGVARRGETTATSRRPGGAERASTMVTNGAPTLVFCPDLVHQGRPRSSFCRDSRGW